MNPSSPLASSSWRVRWLQRGLTLAVILLGWRMAVWAIPSLLPVKQVKERLLAWSHAVLRNTAAVGLGKMQVRMSMGGIGKIEIEEVRIDPPNAFAFTRPLFLADRLRLEIPVWQLWNPATCEPSLEIKEGELRLEWDRSGESNLLGFLDPLDPVPPPGPFPLFHLRPKVVHLSLRESALYLRHEGVNESVRVPLDGRAEIYLHRKEVEASFEPSEIRGGDDSSEAVGRLHLIHLVVSHQEKARFRLETVRLSTHTLPLRFLRFFAPFLPPIPPAWTFTGTILYPHPHSLVLDGVLHGHVFPFLGLPGEEGIEIRTTPIPAEEGMQIQAWIRSHGIPKAQILAEWRREEWSPLSLFASSIDLDRLPSFSDPLLQPTVERFCDTFPSVRLQAETLHFRGLPIRHALVEWVPSRDSSSLSGGGDLMLRGRLVGGDLFLKAKGWVPGDRKEGMELTATLENAKFGETTMRIFADWIPPAISCSPLDGRGTLLLTRSAKAATEEPLWGFQLLAKDLVIPMRGAGEIWREVANLPAALREVEVLRRKALRLPPPPNEPIEPLAAFRILEGGIRYDLFPDGTSRLSRILAIDPDVAAISGGGARDPDGTFRIALVLRNLSPLLLARQPALSEEVRLAILATDERMGLRLDLLLSPDGHRVTPVRRYLEDIFKVWTEMQAGGMRP